MQTPFHFGDGNAKTLRFVTEMKPLNFDSIGLRVGQRLAYIVA